MTGWVLSSISRVESFKVESYAFLYFLKAMFYVLTLGNKSQMRLEWGQQFANKALDAIRALQQRKKNDI